VYVYVYVRARARVTTCFCRSIGYNAVQVRERLNTDTHDVIDD
jgi:hypothetical protein